MFGLNQNEKKLIAGVGGIMIAPYIIIGGIAFLVGSWLWPYSINTWLEYFGRDPVVQWWMGGLLGLIPALGQSVVVIAVITWIAMLIISAG